MDFVTAFGPTVLGLAAGLIIASYLWSRLRSASIAILVWVGIAVGVGQVTFFPGFPEWQPSDWLGFMVFGTLAFAPAGILLLIALRVKRAKDVLDAIPTSALVATQAYRIGGVFLLLAFMRGELPAEIGLVSGVLDLTVAVTAVALALFLRGREDQAPRLVIAWAILGLVDFGWAATALSLSFLGLWSLMPAPVMMGNPPLLVISLFALPFGIFIGVYLIIRMRDIHRAQEGLRGRER